MRPLLVSYNDAPVQQELPENQLTRLGEKVEGFRDLAGKSNAVFHSLFLSQGSIFLEADLPNGFTQHIAIKKGDTLYEDAFFILTGEVVPQNGQQPLEDPNVPSRINTPPTSPRPSDHNSDAPNSASPIPTAGPNGNPTEELEAENGRSHTPAEEEVELNFLLLETETPPPASPRLSEQNTEVGDEEAEFQQEVDQLETETPSPASPRPSELRESFTEEETEALELEVEDSAAPNPPEDEEVEQDFDLLEDVEEPVPNHSGASPLYSWDADSWVIRRPLLLTELDSPAKKRGWATSFCSLTSRQIRQLEKEEEEVSLVVSFQLAQMQSLPTQPLAGHLSRRLSELQSLNHLSS